MRTSRALYPTPKETDFNIFMSGPEWGQPMMLASDIVKNMMEKRTNKKQEQKLTALDLNNYPEFSSRSQRYQPMVTNTRYLKPMSQSTGRNNFGSLPIMSEQHHQESSERGLGRLQSPTELFLKQSYRLSQQQQCVKTDPSNNSLNSTTVAGGVKWPK